MLISLASLVTMVTMCKIEKSFYSKMRPVRLIDKHVHIQNKRIMNQPSFFHLLYTSRFFQTLDFSNLKIIQPKLVSLGFDFSQPHPQFLEPIFVSLQGSKNQESTVSTCPLTQESVKSSWASSNCTFFWCSSESPGQEKNFEIH